MRSTLSFILDSANCGWISRINRPIKLFSKDFYQQIEPRETCHSKIEIAQKVPHSTISFEPTEAKQKLDQIWQIASNQYRVYTHIRLTLASSVFVKFCNWATGLCEIFFLNFSRDAKQYELQHNKHTTCFVAVWKKIEISWNSYFWTFNRLWSVHICSAALSTNEFYARRKQSSTAKLSKTNRDVDIII